MLSKTLVKKATIGINSIPLSIMAYFQTLNGEKYKITANLFTEDGVLYPPFEEPIQGREEISNYLESYSKGYEFTPEEITIECANFGNSKYKVIGEMGNKILKVGVAWYFVLDKSGKIISLRMIIIASLDEFVHLSSSHTR